MKRLLLSILIIIILLAGVFSFMKTDKPGSESPVPTETPVAYACNADGKICPDGSTVGRTGSTCQFKACPLPTATSTTVTTSLGQVATGMNVSITPKTIISDSRCPIDVQCIWAGTVEVRTVLATQVGHGEHTLKLGEPQNFGDYIVTLKEVTPAPKAGEKIPDSSYRFVYEVKRK